MQIKPRAAWSSILSIARAWSTSLRKVLGVAGFGGIGSRVAVMAKAAFGINILVASKSADPDGLLSRSDGASLHLPLVARSG